jgi:hypothetical protein
MAETYRLRWLLVIIPRIEQIIDAIIKGQNKIEIIKSHAFIVLLMFFADVSYNVFAFTTSHHLK